MRVLVVGARRDSVERLLAATRRAGLVPELVDLSAFAMIRALYVPPAEVSTRPRWRSTHSSGSEPGTRGPRRSRRATRGAPRDEPGAVDGEFAGEPGPDERFGDAGTPTAGSPAARSPIRLVRRDPTAAAEETVPQRGSGAGHHVLLRRRRARTWPSPSAPTASSTACCPTAPSRWPPRSPSAAG